MDPVRSVHQSNGLNADTTRSATERSDRADFAEPVGRSDSNGLLESSRAGHRDEGSCAAWATRTCGAPPFGIRLRILRRSDLCPNFGAPTGMGDLARWMRRWRDDPGGRVARRSISQRSCRPVGHAGCRVHARAFLSDSDGSRTWALRIVRSPLRELRRVGLNGHRKSRPPMHRALERLVASPRGQARTPRRALRPPVDVGTMDSSDA